MQKRATAVLVPVALLLAACAPTGEFSGEMPDFTATKDGATLRFGQSAKVVTRDVTHHVPVQWEVKVDKPARIDAPRSASQTAEFICFPVELTPVAVGQFPADVTVALPELSPLDGSSNANAADPAYCAEDGESVSISGYSADLASGEAQRTYVASWVGTAKPGIAGTGVKLSTPDATVSWR